MPNNNGRITRDISDANESSKKEVFHIASNKFTYDEAAEMCKNYDARLATYDEIEDAYNHGASWCSYGWSDDQMALFPTQKKVYNDLKKIPGHENDCGRPGINGGRFRNKNIRFGANCFGIKPLAKDEDKAYMHSINHSPIVNKDVMRRANQKNNEFRKHVIASFNHDKWSQKK